MPKLNRSPLQVSPEFKKRLDEIKKKIMMAQGENKSVREITKDIISNPLFDDIEKSLIKKKDVEIDFKVKLDRRFFQ